MNQADVFRYVVAGLIALSLLAGTAIWSWVAWKIHQERRSK